MTGWQPDSTTLPVISLLSYPRSAKSASALKPSMNARASLQSALAPSVTATLSGIPCASTARCILVLSPLLRDSSPGCRQPLQRHGDALCNGSNQSSATHSQAQPRAPQGVFPKHPGHANGKTGDGYFSSLQGQEADRAMALPFAISRIPR